MYHIYFISTRTKRTFSLTLDIDKRFWNYCIIHCLNK